jgi:adenylate cyclase class 2
VDREIEVKIVIEDPDEAAARIEALGGKPAGPREFEDNRLFDLPGGSLVGQGKMLRVRTVGERCVVTVKAPAEDPRADRYKVKREIETEVSDAAEFAALLGVAGFEPTWRYQKYRRSYELEGTTVVVDELPFGNYLEIEGPPDRIDRVAEKLGLSSDDYEIGSYRELHERICGKSGVPLGPLVFGEGA